MRTRDETQTFFDVVEVKNVNSLEGPKGTVLLEACIPNADNLFYLKEAADSSKQKIRVALLSTRYFESLLKAEQDLEELRRIIIGELFDDTGQE